MTQPDIILFADRHYDSYPGRAQAALLKSFATVHYIEEDYRQLSIALREHPRATLAFNSIASTPGNMEIPAEIEAPLKAHLASAAPLWLIHGGSAAFWPWSWWRQLMPLRWVRDGDPDHAPVSSHPMASLQFVATPDALARFPGLPPLSKLPSDELYIRLVPQHPFTTWLTVTHEGVDHPQACSALSPWGGGIHSFLPGHSAEVLQHPAYISIFTAFARNWLCT